MSKNAIFAPATGPLSIALLILPQASILEVASALDPLRNANRQLGLEAFRWRVVSPDGAPVALTCGLSLPSSGPLEAADGVDVLIVIAGYQLHEGAPRHLIRMLRRMAPRFAMIVGIDAGPWVMARAGLLDGYRATVHWEDLEDLAAAHPDTHVVPDRYVIDRNRVTIGGAAPAQDFMLHLIATRHGAALSRQVANSFLTVARPGHEAQIGPRTSDPALDPRVAAAVADMEARMDAPCSVDEIARRVGLSSRRLETLFHQAFGTTPAAHFLSLRLQAARRMLTDTRHPVAEVALRTGFSSSATMSRAFSRAYGVPPGKFRKTSRYHGVTKA